MRIGYLIDLHKGGYDQPIPTPQEAHETMEAMILEGIAAERAGFHSIQVPDRHGRTECYFPGPEQILDDPRAGNRAGGDRNVYVCRDAVSPDEGGRAVRGHR